jgi:hypothetical protein
MTLNNKIIFSIGLPVLILLVGSMALPIHAFGQGNGQGDIISVIGHKKIQGQDAIVEILVNVEPGQNASDVAQRVLEAQNARPFDSASLGSEGFSLTGLVWDTTVKQRLNNNGGPIDLEDILVATHDTMNGASDSTFDIEFDGHTTDCPSLVRECPGRQDTDSHNDVAWMNLKDRNVLGVAWSTTSPKEADIALNTDFDWNTGCMDVSGKVDVQSVLLHENLHLAGLGHTDDPASVMQTFYGGANCTLVNDDNEGLTFLYDDDPTGIFTGIVVDDNDEPIKGATIKLDGASLSATTSSEGIATIRDIPNPVTYTIIASAPGFDSETVLRVSIEEAESVIIFNLSASESDDNGGGGGGPPSCVPKHHPACQ